MADQELLNLLNQGVQVWNSWRKTNSNMYLLDLQGADLSGADLTGANLSRTDLTLAKLFGTKLSSANLSHALLYTAHLSESNLFYADLTGADLLNAILRGANLSGANLRGANLRGANLRGANLSGAEIVQATLHRADLSFARLTGAEIMESNLSYAHLIQADLRGANLSAAILVGADLRGAQLEECRVYGISAWNTKLEGANQSKLIITGYGEPDVTVDDLEVAQFIYLLLNNQNIRRVVDTITSKAVLILGRFTPERKTVLDAFRDELRRHDYLPILFDFEPSSTRNLIETVSTLAHMARFIIADITDAKSIPQELQRIIPNLPSLSVQPLILSSQYEYAMFKDFMDYPWVLRPYRYDSLEALLAVLKEKVISPAESKAMEVEERRKAFEEDISNRGGGASD